jgi:hypothetical protein
MGGERKKSSSRKLIVSFPSYKHEPEAPKTITASVESPRATDSPKLTRTETPTRDDRLTRRNTVFVEPKVSYVTHVLIYYTKHIFNESYSKISASF